MKIWIKGQIEATDDNCYCMECGKYLSSPELVYVELLLRQLETGNRLCQECGKVKLV